METETTTDETLEIEINATRDEALGLRNSVFSAKYDGRFPADEANEIRETIPAPSDRVTDMTFRLSADEAKTLADALTEAVLVARDEDRDATADSINRDVTALRIAVASL